MNTKTIKKMRFGLTVIAILCLTAGITLMGNIGTTAKADASPLGDTKYNVSTNGEHMLLVTPITDVTDVYEAGYEFTGETPTLEKHATNKYYTSISAGEETWTAKSLFGGDYTTTTPMIVWEVTRDAAKTYSYKAYYKKGTRIDEVLYAKDSDEPQYNAVTTTPLFFTVTFDTDGGSAIASKYLPDGTAASTFADVSTTKAGYTFSKWQVSGEDYNFATATVTADVTLDAVWTANTYYATFKAEGETVGEPVAYTVESASIVEPSVPEKAGYNGAWESYDLTTVDGLTVNAVYTARTDTPYKVEYYKRDLESVSYTKVDADTQNLTGTTDATTDVNAPDNKYTGFTKASTSNVTITADGNAIAKVYYDRIVYSVKYFDAFGEQLDEEEKEYGASLTEPSHPALSNATFDGWYDETYTDEWNYSTGIIEDDVDLYAKYSRSSAAATEFESFNSELSIKSVKTDNADAVMSYCSDEIAGVTGSAKMTVKNSYGYATLKIIPRQTLNEYDYVSFKVYIPESAEHRASDADNDRVILNSASNIDYFIPLGKWMTVNFSRSAITGSVDGDGFATMFMVLNEGGQDRLKNHRNAWTTFEVYITDVKYTNAQALADNKIVDFANASALDTVKAVNDTSYMNGVITTEDVAGHTGEKLALSIKNINGWYPEFKVKTVHNKAYYSGKGYTHIIVSMYIATEGTTKKFPVKTASGWSDKYYNVGEWVFITYTLDDFFNSTYNSETGLTSLFMVQIGENGFGNADIYIGEISLVSNVSTAANDGIVWKASTHTGYYSQGPSGSTTYLDGKMVAKFKLSESGPGNNKVFLNFKTLNNNTVVDVNSVKTAWTNAGYTKVLVTCYIPSDVLSDSSKERGSKTVLFNSDTDIKVYQQRFVGFDEWYTFEMTIDQFWSRYNSSYNFMTLFGAYNSNIANATPAEYYDENFTIYFDSIRLA